jgi:hypothetical protein
MNRAGSVGIRTAGEVPDFELMGRRILVVRDIEVTIKLL